MGNRNPWVAALLSGLLPGLGQFYNRQLRRGALFLVGFLVLAGALIGGVDVDSLERAVSAGAMPDDIWMLVALELLILALAGWSVVDAYRVAKKSWPA